MARKSKQTPVKTCADCVHEYACKGWTHGQELSPENASKCDAFEAVRDTAAYLIGKLEANEGCCSTEESKGLYGKYRIFRANGTPVKGRCFVLKPDKDPAAVKALQAYAAATGDAQLRNDLYEWVGHPMEETNA